MNENIDMQLFLEKCKSGNISENDIPKEILSLFEELYTKRKEQENTKQVQAGSVTYIEGMSLEDIQYINETALQQTEKYTNEKFNMENSTHREYFEYFKQKLLKAKEYEIKMKQFEENLHEKYGTMYEEVENAAINAFENMAYRDARNIILSRMKGDMETLITFYDNIYKSLQSEKDDSKNISENVIFPPKAIKGGNYINSSKKQSGYENFI